MAPPVEPLIVEFVGLPGAGKTTVAEAALATLRGRGYRCLDRLSSAQLMERHNRALRAFLTFSLRHPQTLVKTLSYSAQVKPLNRSSLEHGLKLHKRLFHFDRIPLTGFDVVLLDQFFLQNIWSIGLSGRPPSDRSLKALLREICRSVPFRAVYFEVDAATAASRIGERPTSASRLDRMEVAQAERQLERYGHPLERIVAQFERVSGSPVLRVDAGETVPALSARIVDTIEGQLRGSR